MIDYRNLRSRATLARDTPALAAVLLPTPGEVLELLDVIDAVAVAHAPNQRAWCVRCGVPAPCSTARVLDGLIQPGSLWQVFEEADRG